MVKKKYNTNSLKKQKNRFRDTRKALGAFAGPSALQNGYTVYYRSAFDLVSDLIDAQRSDERKECVKKLCSYQLLIIDEFGMKKNAAFGCR